MSEKKITIQEELQRVENARLFAGAKRRKCDQCGGEFKLIKWSDDDGKSWAELECSHNHKWYIFTAETTCQDCGKKQRVGTEGYDLEFLKLWQGGAEQEELRCLNCTMKKNIADLENGIKEIANSENFKNEFRKKKSTKTFMESLELKNKNIDINEIIVKEVLEENFKDVMKTGLVKDEDIKFIRDTCLKNIKNDRKNNTIGCLAIISIIIIVIMFFWKCS